MRVEVKASEAEMVKVREAEMVKVERWKGAGGIVIGNRRGVTNDKAHVGGLGRCAEESLMTSGIKPEKKWKPSSTDVVGLLNSGR